MLLSIGYLPRYCTYYGDYQWAFEDDNPDKYDPPGQSQCTDVIRRGIKPISPRIVSAVKEFEQSLAFRSIFEQRNARASETDTDKNIRIGVSLLATVIDVMENQIIS